MSGRRAIAIIGLIAIVCVVVAEAQRPEWYYCGKDPVNGPPTIPAPSSRKVAKLDQVSLIIRHGDRSTFGWLPRPGQYGRLQCWPNDTAEWECDVNYETVPGVHRNTSGRKPPTRLFRKLYEDDHNILAGNCDVGQLTKKGYLQQITNGQMIRNYYVDKVGLLPSVLTQTNLPRFFVRSDDEPRTVLSAQSLFLGLYPFDLSPDNETIVIDIHSRSDGINIMTVNPRLCPRIGQYLKEAVQSPEYLKYASSVVAPLMRQLSNILSVPVTDEGQFEDISDCSNAYYCHDMPLHPGVNLSVIQAMEEVDVWAEDYMNSYPDTTTNSRLGIGFLIREIYSHLKNRVHKTRQEADFLLFSGHDTTILPYLTAYKMPPQQWVPYASVVLIELYTVQSGQSGTPYAVRMLYNQKEMLIPGCDDILCSWDNFARISEQLFVSEADYARECAPK